MLLPQVCFVCFSFGQDNTLQGMWHSLPLPGLNLTTTYTSFFLLFCPNIFRLIAFLDLFFGSVQEKNKCQNQRIFFFFQKVKLPISKSLLINFLFWLPPQSWSSHPLDLLGRADEITAPCGHKSPPYTSCKWGNWHIWNPVSFFNPSVAQIQHQGKTSTLKLDSSNS